jgi:hypothetical protein
MATDPSVSAPAGRDESLACPRCAGPLVGSERGLGCERCQAQYPRFGNIPCLLPDPALWQTLWLRRLDDYSSSIEMRVSALREEAEAPDLLPRTRQRLHRTAAGLEQQLEAVTALFSPLDTDTDPLPATAIPSRPEGGSQVAVLEYYEHVFRDWVWGERECAEALAFISPVIPAGLPRVAIYGAGAGRLAVDIHQRCGPARTFGLDVNPLPFLIADRLLAGEELTSRSSRWIRTPPTRW